MSVPTLTSFIREFEGRAHDVMTRHGARVVKLIGDEVMFVATEPGAACRAAGALMEGFADEGKHVFPCAGIAYGNVLVRGGDYYGSVVNLASRLVDEAVPQEVLVTNDLAIAATECDFVPAGRRVVKGFPEPIAVQSLAAPNP
jgi:adenylate cyclase